MLHRFPLAQPPRYTATHQQPAARRRHRWQIVGTSLALLILAGCASDYDTSRYHPSRENTQSDAHRHAQGQRGAMAPSQLQIGFGDAEQRKQAAAERAEAEADSSGSTAALPPRPLRQPQTFLGTMPCLTSDQNCPASRVTLTFSPGGEWRARSQVLGTDSSRQPLAQQGCWEVVGNDPLRVILRTTSDSTRAAFQFVNDSLLRVYRFNDITPRLDYHLTRQPDIDPIDELANEPALNCRPS